ncbi:MAG: pyrroloquinoline quinone biosynthesis protein PqqE, partial [Acetobacteraceae bacterium]|nr:pyrroloquinoline quinone biosynthesis protein PqqE [Acetobacteraceae bacterium]
AHEAGLYTNLITSGIGLTFERLEQLKVAGLDHVQVSIQDTIPDSSDRIAGYAGAHARKLALARHVVESGLALTVNAVVHRANIERIEDLVDLAFSLGAGRVEVAHAQYYGWALRNRAALMPTRAQVMQAMETLERVRAEYEGRLVIDAVVPDYYARFPKPCMGGWARRSLNVTPSGRVLPCHAAETIPGLVFWSVRDKSLAEIWLYSPAFNAFRGTDWMQEPCRSCARRDVDFGGCRCQALAIAGNASATDPACMLSPLHGHMLALAEADSESGDTSYVYRGRTASMVPG